MKSATIISMEAKPNAVIEIEKKTIFDSTKLFQPGLKKRNPKGFVIKNIKIIPKKLKKPPQGYPTT